MLDNVKEVEYREGFVRLGRTTCSRVTVSFKLVLFDLLVICAGVTRRPHQSASQSFIQANSCETIWNGSFSKSVFFLFKNQAQFRRCFF